MIRLLLVALAGCSFATSGPPPHYDGRAEPDCTTSRALPVLDTSVAVFTGAVGLSAILKGGPGCDPNSDCHDDGPAVVRGIGFGLTAVALLYTLGAYVGYRNTRECDAATTKHRAMTAPR